MENNIIAFELSKTIQVEPDRFIYGILNQRVENDELANQRIQEAIQAVGGEQIIRSNDRYTITTNHRDLESIVIVRIKSRAQLEALVERLSKIEQINAGIIRSELDGREAKELELVAILVDKAWEKAKQYAAHISKKAVEIVGLTVKEQRPGGWRASPPARELKRSEIYNAILSNYEHKDNVSIYVKLEVKFRVE